MTTRRWSLALTMVAAACTDPSAIGSGSQEIIGGSPTTAYDSVVMLESTSGLCTGTLITPTVVVWHSQLTRAVVLSSTKAQLPGHSGMLPSSQSPKRTSAARAISCAQPGTPRASPDQGS